MWKRLRTFCCTVQRKFRDASENFPVEETVTASEVPDSVVSDRAVPDEFDPDEFDPVREIKRLRQDLAHRLLELQGADETDREESVEEPLSGSGNFQTGTEKNSDSLTFHIRRARKMLSRLQAEVLLHERGPEKFPAMCLGKIADPFDEAEAETSESEEVTVVSETFIEPVSVTPPIDEESSCVVQTEPMRTAQRGLEEISVDFDPLMLANTGLTGLGILVALAGIVLCCTHVHSFAELGPGLALAGTAVVFFGFFGRFYGPVRDKLDVAC